MTNKEAINILKNAAFLATNSSLQAIEEAVNVAVSALENNEEPKRGKWILREKIKGYPDWICSECGKSGRGDYYFCPWCKTDMRGDSDEQT